MSDIRPAEIPLAGPEDTVERLEDRHYPDRREILYAVVHRGHGLWTHLYRVVVARAPARPEIHLLRVLPGDRLGELRLAYAPMGELAA